MIIWASFMSSYNSLKYACMYVCAAVTLEFYQFTHKSNEKSCCAPAKNLSIRIWSGLNEEVGSGILTCGVRRFRAGFFSSAVSLSFLLSVRNNNRNNNNTWFCLFYIWVRFLRYFFTNRGVGSWYHWNVFWLC